MEIAIVEIEAEVFASAVADLGEGLKIYYVSTQD